MRGNSVYASYHTIMRRYGLMGGSIVFHPHRIKDEIKDRLHFNPTMV